MSLDIRWKQRFQNFTKAFELLKSAVSKKEYSDLEKAGLVQSFEFTFELAWKTLKDYLEEQQVSVNFPRDIIKESFKHDLISDGDTWMDMLEKRNLLSHTDDNARAAPATQLIREKYFPLIEIFYKTFQKKLKDS